MYDYFPKEEFGKHRLRRDHPAHEVQCDLVEFPKIQKANTFTADQAIEKMQSARKRRHAEAF